MIWNLIFVITGGAIGSGLRYILFRLIVFPNFPVGTLGVNIIGSLLIGLIFAYFHNRPDDSALRLFLMTGLLGGFTTFSAFSLETLKIMQSGSFSKATLNITLSVALCLIACFVGMWMARSL